ncbi:replication initiation protein [Paraburkholderia sp. MM6662-R1]|uniref:replication initiation protein n=1 Tax=Paraburkholderia sp. MM6662-R1 TaxID=2991066 RepID=UPI003D1A940D
MNFFTISNTVHAMQPNKTSTNSGDTIVVRANPTLGVIPETGTLTPVTRRLFNVLISIAQREEPEQTKHQRPLREVLRHIGHRNDYKGIQDSLRDLVTTPIEWNQPTQEGGTWAVSTMLAHAKIVQKKSSFILQWSFSEALREEILRPKRNFTKLSLVIHTRIRSGASAALFEYCQRYVTWNDGVMKKQPWGWWVAMLCGTKDHGVTEYKYFKRDILRPAIAEVSTRADFTVELVEHKTGRRVTDLQFVVTPKPPSWDADSGLPPYDEKLILSLVDLGLRQHKAKQICESHDAVVIEDAIEYTKARVADRNQPPVKSIPAYFMKALADRYGKSKGAARPQAELDLADPTAEQAKLREAYAAHQWREAYGYWMELDTEPKNALIAEFLTTDVPAVTARAIKKDLLKTMPARTAFSTWLAAKLWGEPTTDDLLTFALARKPERADAAV